MKMIMTFFSFNYAVELCFNFNLKRFLFLLEKDTREIFSGSDEPPYSTKDGWKQIESMDEGHPLILAFAVSFLTTDFAKCHVSNWCLIAVYNFFMLEDTVGCLSVDKHLTGLSLSIRKLRDRLHPSTSMALEDVTSVTWTSWKSMILPVDSSMRVYVPYFAL